MTDDFNTTNYMIFFKEKLAFKLAPDGSYLNGDFYEEALDEYGKEFLEDLPVTDRQGIR